MGMVVGHIGAIELVTMALEQIPHLEEGVIERFDVMTLRWVKVAVGYSSCIFLALAVTQNTTALHLGSSSAVWVLPFLVCRIVARPDPTGRPFIRCYSESHTAQSTVMCLTSLKLWLRIKSRSQGGHLVLIECMQLPPSIGKYHLLIGATWRPLSHKRVWLPNAMLELLVPLLSRQPTLTFSTLT